MAYALPAGLPRERLPAGANALVGGPPLSGKQAVAADVVEFGCERGEGAVYVTARESAVHLLDRYPAMRTAVEERRAGVVDCVSKQRGDRTVDEEFVKYVSSPGNVTDVGIRVAGLMQSIEDAVDRVRVCVNSASTMLMYTDERRLFRFLHVFTGQVTDRDWLGLTVLETSDRSAFDVLSPLYDGMIQLRSDDAGREVRFVGFDEDSTPWTPYRSP